MHVYTVGKEDCIAPTLFHRQTVAKNIVSKVLFLLNVNSIF